MKRIMILAAIAIFAASCGPRGGKAEGNDAQTDSTATKQTEMEQKRIEEPEFDIITSKGTMRVKLYSKTPKHRDNFVKLVKENYYDGIRFHRVIEGFMIQGGDPKADGTGGNTDASGKEINIFEVVRNPKLKEQLDLEILKIEKRYGLLEEEVLC